MTICTSCYPESSYNIITGDNSSKILIGTAGNDLIYGTERNDMESMDRR